MNYGVGISPFSIALGDFNGDRILDLAVANEGSSINFGNISVLLGKGNGTFQLAVDYSAGRGPSSVAVGDFNQDGILDLVTANPDSNDVSLLLGNGDGTFRPEVGYGAGRDLFALL